VKSDLEQKDKRQSQRSPLFALSLGAASMAVLTLLTLPAPEAARGVAENATTSTASQRLTSGGAGAATRTADYPAFGDQVLPSVSSGHLGDRASVARGGARVCAAAATRAQAVVGTLRDGRLARLNARTLAPLPSPRPLQPHALHWTVSPERSRVAVVGRTRAVVIIDARRLRVAHSVRNEGFDASKQLIWPSDSLLVAVGDSAFGYEYTAFSPTAPSAGGSEDSIAPPVAVVREGVVLEYNAQEVQMYGAVDWFVDLPGLPSNPSYPNAFAADPRHDRFFVISAAGVVAEVDLPTAVSYHQVALAGGPVQAAWAGNGQIAVWGAGAGGLARINTRNWSVHPIATDITDVVATRHGLVAWTRGGSKGVAVYLPSGALRLRVLRGHTVSSVASLGPYAYVSAGRRFSVNLCNGRVAGPLKSRAQPILPDVVGIQ
jgi:hypothetical protein